MKQSFKKTLFAGALSLALIGLGTIPGNAQDITIAIPDTLKGWANEWVGSLNGSQAAYSNWSQGGVNTISGTASTLYQAKFKKDKFGYGFGLNLKYGKSKINADEVRKTDDLILVKNKFTYNFDHSAWSGIGSLTFNTQFDKGYDYEVDPAVLQSQFMAPGYFKELLGVSYQPVDYFSAEGGLGMKQTIVSETDLSTLYGLEEGENFRFEAGVSLNTGIELEVLPNFIYTGNAELFYNPENDMSYTDVVFSNELVGKINNLINTSLQFVLQYDKDYSTEVQIKQVLSLGVSFRLI
jgi:hypothetical protein